MISFNIKNIVKKIKFLKVFLYICQAIFAMVILFVVGVYYNNEYEQNAIMEFGTTLSIYIGNQTNRAQYVDTELVQDKFMDIFSKYENIIEAFYIDGDGRCDEGKMIIRSNFSIENGMYVPLESKLEIYTEGRFFNVDDMNNGEKVCIIPIMFAENHHETIEINDVEYKVIAYQDKEIDEKGLMYWGNVCFVPFKSLGPEEKIYEVAVQFKRPLMESEYNYIKDKATMYWGKKVKLSDYIAEDLDDGSVKNTINYIIILIGVLAAITMCALYYYIIVKKTKPNAVKVLCGCSVRRLIIFQIMEIVACMLINSIIGGIIYFKFLYNFLAKKYMWFSVIYGKEVVVNNLSAYLSIIVVICSVYVVCVMRKEPVEMLRNAKKI